MRGMTRPSKGPVARKTASKARRMNRKPKGTAGSHPMTSATGNVKMTRMHKGVDRRKTGKGAKSTGGKSLEGKWF